LDVPLPAICVSRRRIQQLVKYYRETGEYPMLDKKRRPKTHLSDDEKRIIEYAYNESFFWIHKYTVLIQVIVQPCESCQVFLMHRLWVQVIKEIGVEPFSHICNGHIVISAKETVES